MFNTSQQVGAAVGLAILVAVSSDRTKTLVASLGKSPSSQLAALTGGFGFALTFAIGFAAIGLIFVVLVVIRETECQ